MLGDLLADLIQLLDPGMLQRVAFQVVGKLHPRRSSIDVMAQQRTAALLIGDVKSSGRLYRLLTATVSPRKFSCNVAAMLLAVLCQWPLSPVIAQSMTSW